LRRRAAAAALGLAPILLAPGAGAAAQPPGRELSGGYSSLRLGGERLGGGSLALSWPLRGKLRLCAEATLHGGRSEGEDLAEQALLFGPSLAPRAGRRLRPFAHVRAGLMRSRRQLEVFGVAIGREGVCDGGCPWRFGVAGEVGGGLDLRLLRRLAVRLPQLDFQLTSAGEARSRLRVSAGLVWRWTGPAPVP